MRIWFNWTTNSLIIAIISTKSRRIIVIIRSLLNNEYIINKIVIKLIRINIKIRNKRKINSSTINWINIIARKFNIDKMHFFRRKIKWHSNWIINYFSR